MTYRVGDKGADLYLGVHGDVTFVGDGLVTIGGVTLPTHLSRMAPDDDYRAGVVWLSEEAPDLEHEECGVDVDYDDGGYNRGRDDERDDWVTLVRERHDDEHANVWRWCPDRVCQHARRVGPQ